MHVGHTLEQSAYEMVEPTRPVEGAPSWGNLQQKQFVLPAKTDFATDRHCVESLQCVAAEWAVACDASAFADDTVESQCDWGISVCSLSIHPDNRGADDSLNMLQRQRRPRPAAARRAQRRRRRPTARSGPRAQSSTGHLLGSTSWRRGRRWRLPRTRSRWRNHLLPCSDRSAVLLWRPGALAWSRASNASSSTSWRRSRRWRPQRMRSR